VSRRDLLAGAAIGGAGAVLLGALRRSAPVRFARMAGSSIAGPDAAGWVTDFLNAAYYARPAHQRDLDDLRLAFAIVTTRWYELGRRLRAHDVAAFHRAFGRLRLADSPASPRGTLTAAELRQGAAALHGGWFPDAYADDERRGWGVVFPSMEAKAAYRPETRLELARVGPLNPPSAPEREQVWHTYPPVEVPGVAEAAAAVTAPETWPDYASELGRFTPLRTGGLDQQTFEIEVVGLLAAKAPAWLRGYVTVTRLLTAGADLDAYVAELNDGLARFGRDEPPAVPAGAAPAAAFDLTCHVDHFMGSARNRLVLYEHDGRAYLRAAGTWDPMPLHLHQVYERFGHYAQHAFWGMESPEESMLHQIAGRLA
jgi:hypothetical protein